MKSDNQNLWRRISQSEGEGLVVYQIKFDLLNLQIKLGKMVQKKVFRNKNKMNRLSKLLK